MRRLLLCACIAGAAWAGNKPTPPAQFICSRGSGTSKSTETVVHEAWEPLKKDPNFVGLAVGVIRNGEAAPFKDFTGVKGKSLGANTKPDGQTLYEIGSITKTFTGILLAFAHQKGKADPADLVSKYLPSDVKLLKDRSNITLSDLAIHGAGFMKTPCNNDCPTKRKDDEGNCVFTRDQLWQAVATCPLAAADRDKQVMPDGIFVPSQVSTRTNQDDLADVTPFGPRNTEITPHQETHYSNLGFSALGRLLEKPMGDTWENLVKQHIIDAIGMKNTLVQSNPLDPAHTNVAFPNGDALSDWEFGTQPLGNPAGALHSNIDDMLLFLAALRAQNVPDHADLTKAIKEALTPVPYGNKKSARGFGVGSKQLLESSCAEIVWKDGGMPGFTSWIGWVPSDGNAVIVLANWNTAKGAAPPTQIGERILRALHGITSSP